MSMLAEPRRKQKWSVDPRNSSWSNDDSKFGQKMLERMGWSKGKGLGRSEQGATDHIKVKLKNNSLGLGANISHEDNWIAHQDDFNELLAQLNNCHGQSNMPEPQPDEQGASKGFSLEEKSKTSKKRVHYMKFTKGKDLSSRSKTDLNCIFGKRGRSTKDEEQESSSSRDSPSDKEGSATPPCTELDTESIANTVTSTMTMQEYFAQRMAQLKKARGQASTPAAEAETLESSSPSGEVSPAHSAEENTEEPKKKKKKKSKRATDEVEAVEEEACGDPITIQADEDQEPTKKKKKKKKRKNAEDECPSNENSNSGAEQACEEAPPAKKKKSKKHTEDSEPTNQEQTQDSELVHKKKKKKKSKEEANDAGQMDTEEPVEKKSKKHKKKKHQEQD